MNEIFLKRIKEYFKEDYDAYLNSLNEPRHHSFFLNTKKTNKENILSFIDFDYETSKYSDDSFIHNNESIGKTIAYDLGLIYPQNIESSLPAKLPTIKENMLVLDMCASPGGKSINILNRLDDNSLLISNEYSYPRCEVLVSNLERLGLSNVIVTNKNTEIISNELEGRCDLVIVDAPCSGEGIVRKYPEIIDDYNEENIKELASLQSKILEDAYRACKYNGEILYSTCTYSYEEDEDQIKSFLKRHNDLTIVPTNSYPSISKVNGTIKMTTLDETEGQFFCLIKKNSNEDFSIKIKYLKEYHNKIIDSFISDNLNIEKYYLYEHNNHYYISLMPLFDLKNNVLRYGIYLGDLKKDRFEPSHSLYRSNVLRNKFKNIYDLNDSELKSYLNGLELKADIKDGYYLVTYKGLSLGFVKASKGVLKNKYPKGLRRMV